MDFRHTQVMGWAREQVSTPEKRTRAIPEAMNADCGYDKRRDEPTEPENIIKFPPGAVS